MHALGTGGIPNGVNIGAGCNRLYVDFTKPVALLSLIAWGNGHAEQTYFQAWQSEFASLGIWLQGAWLDSTSKTLKLTAGAQVNFPREVPSGQPVRYRSFLNQDPSATVGRSPAVEAFPYMRYKLR